MLAKHDQAEGERLSSLLYDGGHDVQRVSHPSQAQSTILTAALELLLMKWTQPKRESINMLLALRANIQTCDLPVIVLSRHSDARAKIAALDTGTDDYVVKPRDTGELHAHIRAVLRRRASYQHGDDVLQVDGLRLDPFTLGVTAQTEADPRAIALSPLEFRLLHFLVAHSQRMHSRTRLLDRVWDSYVSVGERTVDVRVRKLRVALTGTPCDDLIQTVRGGSYRLVAGTNDTTTTCTAEAVDMQLEAATHKAELPVYRHIPATRSFGPTQLGA